jgi:K+-transporting ATPase ATPase C chain
MKTLIISVKIFFLFVILTGIIYPLAVTGAAQFLFPEKAKGSLVYNDGKIAGSSLIAQQSDSSIYFSSRPSATGYNALPSGASNYGMTSSKFRQIVSIRRENFIKFNSLDSNTIVPAEMLCASASGLDPHISYRAAILQAERVITARKFNQVQRHLLYELIKKEAGEYQPFSSGDATINVLLLNLNIDKIK